MSEFDETPDTPPPPPPPAEREKTYFEKCVCVIYDAFSKPVEMLHDFVVSDRTPYEWYHQTFARVPTIDECEEDDPVCFAEANMQYKRDRMVDSEIIGILRQRFENCMMYQNPHHIEKCADVLNEYEEASNNWFTKYGDLGGYHDVIKCYMKQKHRLLWERKHGEVGNGMKEEEKEAEGEVETEETEKKVEC